jgi:exodeoxyribonuclease VII small subunit
MAVTASKDDIELLSFEDSYDRLEKVIESLETGQLGLDKSIALYEEGIRLARHCGKKLDDAQLKVTQLLEAAAGEIDASADQEF